MYNSNIDEIRFDWDPLKGETNLRKHGVTFEEASTVFHDPYGLIIEDPEHSWDEERFVLLGLSWQSRLLIVCHCYRGEAGEIRIISARKATRHESKAHETRRNGHA